MPNSLTTAIARRKPNEITEIGYERLLPVNDNWKKKTKSSLNGLCTSFGCSLRINASERQAKGENHTQQIPKNVLKHRIEIIVK